MILRFTTISRSEPPSHSSCRMYSRQSWHVGTNIDTHEGEDQATAVGVGSGRHAHLAREDYEAQAPRPCYAALHTVLHCMLSTVSAPLSHPGTSSACARVTCSVRVKAHEGAWPAGTHDVVAKEPK